MAQKNRNFSKRKTQRQGLSGNPQRRAEQLETDRPMRSAPQERQELNPQPGAGIDPLRNLSFRLAGGVEAAPWWRDSHERVLQKARAVDWPASLPGIEDQACELVGGQFYDDLQAHEGGHHPTQWLRALVDYTGAGLRKAIADGGGWEPLWRLLYGIALTAPEPTAGDERESELREEFPEIEDPYPTAVAELEEAATLLSHSERSQMTALKLPVSGAVPTGAPLLARDAYGSRFLVAAPFGYEAGVPDHWYAWDVDACSLHYVAGAGTFGSADEALTEWRGAAGTAADSELSPGNPGLVASLLAPCLEPGPVSEMLEGNEPRELIREWYRMRRRARALAGTAFGVPDGTPQDAELGDVEQLGRPPEAHKAFRAWYRERHPEASKATAGTAERIIDEWGPLVPLDERSFYACSPLRVAMTAHLISTTYDPVYASRAIRLLPEWTQWCAQQSGIPGDLAAPSIAAARDAVDTLAERGAEQLPDPAYTTPFRHQE